MKKRFAVLTFSILTTMNGYMTKAEEIQQRNCRICGSCRSKIYGVTEEEFRKAKEAYWKASMGGMLGDCSCTNDYSVNFENCKYNTERGIGNTDLPDVGEKE